LVLNAGGGPGFTFLVSIVSDCTSDFLCVQDCVARESFEVLPFDQEVLCATRVNERGECALGFMEFEDVSIIAQVFAFG
jgi:hypothetical protein